MFTIVFDGLMLNKRRRKRPGREKGHPAALRPMPDHIDFHQTVPLPVDGEGRESCPVCSSCLNELEGHERLNEDVIPVKVVTIRNCCWRCAAHRSCMRMKPAGGSMAETAGCGQSPVTTKLFFMWTKAAAAR